MLGAFADSDEKAIRQRCLEDVMQEVKTYLELSEEGGSSHKFYEAIVNGNQLVIRFGRIGEAGQTQTKEFADAAKALAEANKRINEVTAAVVVAS